MNRTNKISQYPVVGIAAEYNPFHNGHALHIARARACFRAPVPVVAALSSSFTQRGLPALADKWTRTRMALENGADLVLELPFVYACNAGPEFARGAVDILARTKFVTHLAFGTEMPPPESSKSGDPEAAFMKTLDTITDILIHEPPSFKLHLKKKLAAGASYSKAFAESLERELPGSGSVISTPNNSLALSYLLRIRQKNYALTPLALRREGAGYHDGGVAPLSVAPLSVAPLGAASLIDAPCNARLLASAAAIRSALEKGLWDEPWLASALPASSLGLLREERKRGRLCLGTEHLWRLLQGLLSRSPPEELRQCAGMDEGLENLFLKHYLKADSFEDFIGRCVCARYTRSRLQRQAIRCLAGVNRQVPASLRDAPPYIRVLGFNERGRSLLRERRRSVRGEKEIKEIEEEIPVITRLGALSGERAREVADLEFRASRLRELLLPQPDLCREERQTPVEFFANSANSAGAF